MLRALAILLLLLLTSHSLRRCEMAMAMSTGGLPERQHLEGTSNYNDWKFAMRMFLIDAGLWSTVSLEADDTHFNVEKDQRALAKICLSVKPVAYGHIRAEVTAKDAWIKLQRAYEDSGLSRRLGLLTTLMGIRFSQFKCMEEYITKIVTTAQQLKDIQKSIDDELLGALMLAGLPQSFKPLILGIEGSGKVITSDFVKSLLLQEDVRNEFDMKNLENDTAFAANKNKHKPQMKKKWKDNNRGGSKGQEHSGNKNEFNNKRSSTDKNKEKNAFHDGLAVKNTEGQWYTESGAARHLTACRVWQENYSPTKGKDVIVENGDVVQCGGTCDVALSLSVNGDCVPVTAYDLCLA